MPSVSISYSSTITPADLNKDGVLVVGKLEDFEKAKENAMDMLLTKSGGLLDKEVGF